MITPKIAAFAPMPKASVSAIVAVSPGERRTILRASLTSFDTPSSDRGHMPLLFELDMTRSGLRLTTSARFSRSY